MEPTPIPLDYVGSVPTPNYRPVMSLGLGEANQIANAALKEAENRGVNVSVSVCDAQGRLIVHQRMDNTWVEAPHYSIGKAIAAVTFGSATGGAPKIVEGYGPAGEVRAEGAPFMNRKGGLPMFRLGELIAAIGVSGTADEEIDEQCARAGIFALHEPT